MNKGNGGIGGRAGRGAALMIGMLALGAWPAAAGAADYTVDATADAPDVRPGDRICATAVAMCTLRAAVQEAGASPGADVILLPPGHFRLAIPPEPSAGTILDDDPADGDLDIADTLTVRGAGARETTVDGAGLDRVFSSNTGVTVLISDLTVTGGDATGGGASQSIDLGGGLYNRGTMTLERLRVIGNRADGGGGVFSIPRTYLTVRDSLVAGNNAVEGGGLRIDSGGEVVNSTITGNVLRTEPAAALLPDEMSGYGGGIDHRGGNDVAIVQSTITGNHALKGGGGVSSGQGYVPVSERVALGRVRLRNSIVALNTSEHGAADCHTSAQIIESAGHNLDGDGTCSLGADGDLPGRDPLLAPLADNGGPTETLALLPGSPAIDAAPEEGCPRHDQRGIARPAGGACDIGAFEHVAPAPTPADDARCTPPRRVVVRVDRPGLRRLRVTVDGRRARVRRRGARRVVRVDLRRASGSEVRVVIRGVTRGGRALTRVRRLRVCP